MSTGTKFSGLATYNNFPWLPCRPRQALLAAKKVTSKFRGSNPRDLVPDTFGMTSVYAMTVLRHIINIQVSYSIP